MQALTERHGLTLRTAERRVTAAYDQMSEESKAERAKQLSMAREAAASEIRRIRADIARADSSRVKWRLSKVMLGWEVHLARLNGILLGRADQFAESGEITLVLGLPVPGAGPESLPEPE